MVLVEVGEVGGVGGVVVLLGGGVIEVVVLG